jgi:hypothetical protein
VGADRLVEQVVDRVLVQVIAASRLEWFLRSAAV